MFLSHMYYVTTTSLALVLTLLSATSLILGITSVAAWRRQSEANANLTATLGHLRPAVLRVRSATLPTGPFSDGQLLIGNGATGNLVANTLTAGAGIAIDNGPGSIRVAHRPPETIQIVSRGEPFAVPVPAGATLVLATAIGGGGGGASGAQEVYPPPLPGGGGGGGGGVVKDVPFLLQNLDGSDVTHITGTVGGGGSGGAARTKTTDRGYDGADGTPTTVNVGSRFIIAFGGGGGGVNGTGGRGGTGTVDNSKSIVLSGGRGGVLHEYPPDDAVWGAYIIAGAGGGHGGDLPSARASAGGAFLPGVANGGLPSTCIMTFTVTPCAGGGAGGYDGNGGFAGGATAGAGVGHGSGGGGSSTSIDAGGRGGHGMVILTFLFT